MERITSRHNPIVAAFRDVARGRSDDDRALLDGVHLVREAVASGVPLDLVAIADPLLARQDEEIQRLVSALTALPVRVVTVTPAVMSASSPARTPTGVVAIGRPHRATLADVLAPGLLRAAPPTASPALIVVLVDVQDPGNVGAVVRAAEAGGATGVITCGVTADPFGWKALRGAMGSSFRLPVTRSPDAIATMTAIRAAGISIAASLQAAPTSIWDADFLPPLAVLIGNEGAGLDPALVEMADRLVSIPMAGRVESLNAAVAAALIVYEARRQRQSG